MNEYKLVLGLEVHLHLKTKNKMFCGCSADIYGDSPNTHTCPVCLGLPGALPVPNFDAVEKTQLLGLALHCSLNKNSKFDRKHYFYPDLPKGYQISQYQEPLCGEGYLELESGKRALIERIHLEEDAAKSFHEKGITMIDYNKSSMPLVEIVTKPTFTDVADAVDFCKQIQEIVRTLEIGDADMEKGQMRLEANISMRTSQMEVAGELPKYKVEIKNINSFRFMEKAVKYEMTRQSELLSLGQSVAQENRGFDEVHNKTVSQRDKEEAHDYRYFPEPDIPPMVFDEHHFEKIKSSMVELPYDIVAKLIGSGLSKQEAYFFSMYSNKELYKKYIDLINAGIDAKKLAKLFVNKPESRELSKEELNKLVSQPADLISDEQVIKDAITKAIDANPQAIADYKKGKTNAIEFLVGQVMRDTKGKAKVDIVRQLLIEQL